MKPRRLTTKNVTVKVWPSDKTLPVYVTLRGNSYAYLSKSEARRLGEYLISAWHLCAEAREKGVVK